MPVSHLTLLGEHPNSNGRVWKIFADNQTVDVTPAVTSTHTNYDFTVSATKLKLKLIRNSIDVTGMVQPVYVGEPISLLCELNPPVHPISNFNWTVPGLTISNYVADASTGKVHHAYSTTNSTVTFHWVDGHELATIVVSAQINGFTLFGVTYFKVQRPNATLIAELLNVVAVDNDYRAGAIPALHFGNDSVPGIKFSYTNPEVGQYQWVQLGTTIRRVKAFEDSIWYRSVGNGSDHTYPYPKTIINGITQEWAYDIPGMGPLESDPEYAVTDTFQMYLMYKPIVSGAVWVPLRRTDWNWSGHAILQNGSYSLSSGSRSISSSNIDTLQHPEWTTNIANGIYVYQPE